MYAGHDRRESKIFLYCTIGLLEIKTILPDGESLKMVKTRVERLQQMSGCGSTKHPSWLMQTAQGARAEPTRTNIALRRIP
jgi:hypothetical protein